MAQYLQLASKLRIVILPLLKTRRPRRTVLWLMVPS